MEPPELDFSPPFHSTRRLQQTPLFETVFCDSMRHWKIFHTVPSPVVIARFRNLQIKFLRAMLLLDPKCYNLLLNKFIDN